MEAFLKECKDKGIQVVCKDGKNLSYKASKGPIDRNMLIFMKEHKEQLIAYLSGESTEESVKSNPVVNSAENRYKEFPLTDIQSAYYAGRQNEYEYGGTGCYTYLEIKTERIDTERFAEAWYQTIMRHDMLRAMITKEGKQLVRETVDAPELEVYEVNEDGKPIEENNLVQEMRNKCNAFDFRLEAYPMHKFVIARGREHSIVHFMVDMLVADYISINIILSDVFGYYANGRFDDSARTDLTFKNIVLERAEKKATAEDKEYWMKKIDENRFATPDLPLKTNADSSRKTVTFSRKKMLISAKEYQDFRNIVLKNGITVSNAVLATYAKVLANWCEEKRICINITLMQRTEEEKKIIGDFTSVNLLTLDVEEENFKEFAKKTQKTLLSDMSHMSYSGVEVMRKLNKTSGRKVMFPVVFTSTVGADTSHEEVSALNIIGGISRTPQVWIDCQVLERNGELEIHWDVRDGVFENEILDDIWNTFCASIDTIRMVAEWETINDITYNPGYFDKRDAYNHVEKTWEIGMLYDGFISNVKKQPEKTAIIYDGQSYSYGKLGEYVGSIVNALKEKGLQRGDRVALVLPRGPLQIATALATLICGAAFVPIDINQPFNRQERIVLESESHLVMALGEHTRMKEAFKDRVLNPEMLIETPGELVANEDNRKQDLAYIIFTSGTTGAPKGVMITHEQAENTIIDMNERFGINEKDVFIALTKLSFDLSIYDLFGSFDASATLVIPTESNATNPANWLELVKAYRVTIWNSVPALLKMFLKELQSEQSADVSSLRCFFLSGDVIDASIPGQLRERFDNYKLISLGGATEGSIWSIWWDITEADNGGMLPYGVALTNQKMFVLNANGKQAPDNVKGEIVIGGAGVAAGYYKDEELTNKKFAYSEALKTRVFYTGDVGYVRSDGVMMICGRKDNQIKINGNRIEIGEIESVVRATKEAADCVVVYHKSPTKEGKLFLFLEPKTDEEEAEAGAQEQTDYQEVFEVCRREFDDVDRKDYMRWRMQSDMAALADMYAFFRQIGIFLEADRVYTNQEIHDACKEQEEFNTIIDRFLRALAEAGLIIEAENGYRLCHNAAEYVERDRIWDEFMQIGREINYGEKLMQYQRESGKHILEQVRGEITGISMFFPKGSTEVAIAAYRENMVNLRLNKIVLNIMKKFVKSGDRILEIGAGVGGTTTTVLEGLDVDNIRYCFTDVSQFFLNKAQNVYNKYDFIDYKILDINKDYDAQGFAESTYDVILCANVLHNSTNIGVNLSKIRKLLKPNGHLIIIEATGESYLLTTSLELKGGLSGFTDHRACGIDVFTSEEKWVSLIKEAGYEHVFTLPEGTDVLSECGQSVLLCHKKAENSSRASGKMKREGSAGGINVASIEKYMASNLPVYMIPEQIEIVDKIPLTSNGKVDRKKLASICEERLSEAKECIKPNDNMNSLQQKIADIWKEVLNLENVGKQDNFYYVGGDSLLITQVVSEMRKRIPGLEEVGWDELMHNALNNPTIEGLADVIKENVKAEMAEGKQNTACGSGGEEESCNEANNQVLKDSSVVVYRDNPEKRKSVQAFFHAGTGRLADYEFLVPDLMKHTGEEQSMIGFVYGNDTEYLSASAEQLVYVRAEKYASILLELKAKKYELIGYCVGGFLALETAKIMMERGANVSQVVMISSELATHMVSNQMLMEIAYGAAIGLDMSKTGFDLNIDEMKEALEGILNGENRNIKNSELMRLSGNYQKYADLFMDLGDQTHEERLKYIFDSAGGDKFNGNESTFAMFKLLYNIFEHTFKGMMHYPFTGAYLGKVLYLEAPTVNSFYPHTRPGQEFSDVCVGDFTVQKVSGNHATCLLKENYKDVLGAILGKKK